MNEEELKSLVDTYGAIIKDVEKKEMPRLLMALAREVERGTRQAAVSLVYKLANDINALKDA